MSSPFRHARRVLLIEPNGFGFNQETAGSNAFQHADANVRASADAAVLEHRALRDQLIEAGVHVLETKGRAGSPDALFCNNWFSTHAADGARGSRLALYPMLAPNRRAERVASLIETLRERYVELFDFTAHEQREEFLEGTGSLVLDHGARVAYAALSPRTHKTVCEGWAQAMGYKLIAFTATDSKGGPYYHTNVMLFLAHGIAGVCLESVENEAERHALRSSLEQSHRLLPITRAQVDDFAGNALGLCDADGEPIIVCSEQAWRAFDPAQRTMLEERAKMIVAPLPTIERIGGGSARCLIGELY